MPKSHIVAMGGGGFTCEEDASLVEYILGLTGKKEPKVCWVPTAVGDNDLYVAKFYEALCKRTKASHLALFMRTVEDLRSFIMDQDVIWVCGGNTASMLAVWRRHGLDEILRDAWEAGIVMCGGSAGAICWFDAGTTDSWGPTLGPLDGCLGFLGGSFCPHYDSEPQREPLYTRLVVEGFPAGYAADDGAGVHFVGTELHQVVSGRPGARAFHVEKQGGKAVQKALEVKRLG